MGDKKHREKKKAKGLCVNCTKRAVAGKTRCKDCAERDARDSRRRNVKYRKYRKDNRLCTHCKAELLDDENLVCINCSRMNKYMEAGKWKE